MMRSTLFTLLLTALGATTAADAQQRPALISYDVLTGETQTIPQPPRATTPHLGSVAVDCPIGSWQDLAHFGPQPHDDEDWSPHCKVISVFPDGTSVTSSGVFIDPYHVLTVGAAVHTGEFFGPWAESIIVAPAWDGDDDEAGTANATNFSSWASWTNNGDLNGNQGFIRLDEPIGFLSGWYGLGSNNDDDASMLSAPFLVGGYPITCYDGAPDQLHGYLGLWNSVDGGELSITTSLPCTSVGLFGGPATVAPVSGQLEVVGVVAESTESGGATTELRASRVWQFMVDYYVAQIPIAYSATTLKVIPQKCRVEQSVAETGSNVDVSFQLSNASLIDPAPFGLTWSVRLSEDAVIDDGDPIIAGGQLTGTFDSKTTKTVSANASISSSVPPGEYFVGVRVGYAGSDIEATAGWHVDTLKVVTDDPYENLGCALPGLFGNPVLAHTGDLTLGSSNTISLVNAAPNRIASLFFSLAESSIAFKGGTIKAFSLPSPLILLTTPTNALGQVTLPFVFEEEAPFGIDLYFQWVIADPAGPQGFSMSNAVRGFTQ